jgi:hypothetical protein
MRKTKVEKEELPKGKTPKTVKKVKASPKEEVKPKRLKKVKVEKSKEVAVKMKKPPVPKKENAKAGKVKAPKPVRMKREPRPPKPKKQYARIVKLVEGQFSMDYLIGRIVKVLEHSTEKMLYCIVQHPGYEGLEMAFHPSEVEFIEKLKKEK